MTTLENPAPAARPAGSAICEVSKYNQRPISGKGKDHVWPKCGKPAWYVWTPRGNPDTYMVVCKECGEGLAGNFTDELKRYSPSAQVSGGANNPRA